MLEKKNMVKGFIALLAVGVMLAFSPTSEAAIGFPGRQETAQKPATTQQDTNLSNIPKSSEVEKQAKPKQKREEHQMMQDKQEKMSSKAQYPALIAKSVKEGEQTAIYEGKNLEGYFQHVGLKHKDKFFVYCANAEAAKVMKTEIEKLGFKTEEVKEAGKIPPTVDRQMCMAMGTEDVYALIATYKDPNHKSWLQKNWPTMLGALSIFGI